MHNNVVESGIEQSFETDHAFRLTYPVYSAPVDVRNAIEVDLLVLETLAAEYNVPHFKIEDFEKVDVFGRQPIKGWALHFAHIANSGLIVAYEKKKEKSTEEPCAAKLAQQEIEGKVTA